MSNRRRETRRYIRPGSFISGMDCTAHTSPNARAAGILSEICIEISRRPLVLPAVPAGKRSTLTVFRTGVISFFRASWNIHQAYDYVSTGAGLIRLSTATAGAFNLLAAIRLGIAPDITLHSFANVIPRWININVPRARLRLFVLTMPWEWRLLKYISPWQ